MIMRIFFASVQRPTYESKSCSSILGISQFQGHSWPLEEMLAALRGFIEMLRADGGVAPV